MPRRTGGATAVEENAVSFNPEEMTLGGQLPQGIYTFIGARCMVDDYNGQGPDHPAIEVTLENEEGVESDHNLSAGSLERLVPNAAETGFTGPGGKAEKMSKNCKAGRFMVSLIRAGFPVPRMLADIRFLVGLKADLETISYALGGKARDGGEMPKETETFIVKEDGGIIELPGDGKSTRRSAPATATKTRRRRKAEDNGAAITPKAAEKIVDGIIEDAGKKGITLKKLVDQLDGSDADAIAAMITDEDWFMDDARPWGMDGSKVYPGSEFDD